MYNIAKVIKSAKDCDVRLLDKELEKGANINEANSNLLLYAVLFGDLYSKNKYIDFLIKNNIDINQKSSTGRTALHFASMYSDFETVKQLVDNGIDINAINFKNYNALMEACDSIPLQAYIKLNSEMEDLGITLGEETIICGYVNMLYKLKNERKILKDNQNKIIEYLLANGIDKEQLSKDNYSALDLAIENKYVADTKMVELLSNYGVKMNAKHNTNFDFADELFQGGPIAFISDSIENHRKIKKLELVNKNN